MQFTCTYDPDIQTDIEIYFPIVRRVQKARNRARQTWLFQQHLARRKTINAVAMWNPCTGRYEARAI
jgi:hypothetical protein